MKRVAFQSACAVATLAGALALWRLRHAVLLLSIAVALAAAANVGIRSLVSHRVPRRVAILLVHVLAVLVVAGAIALSINTAAHELSKAGDALQHTYARLRTFLPAEGRFARELAQRLPDPAHFLDGSALGEVALDGLGLTQNAFGAGAEAAIVLVLSLLWTLSVEPFERLVLSLMPAASRSRLHRDWQLLRDRVGLEVCSQLGQSLLLASTCGVAFTALGLPYPILAALAIGVLRMIPLIGPVLVVVVAFACGASRGPVHGGAAFAITLLAVTLLQLVVAERIFGARRLHPLLVGVVLLSLWDASDLAALLACAPLAAALTTIANQLLAPAAAPAARRLLEDLALRYAQLEKLVELSPAERPRLQGLIDRLGELIQAAAPN